MKNSGALLLQCLGILILVFALSSCGSKQPGSADAYQEGSDLCSQVFVDDSNALGELKISENNVSTLNTADRVINEYEAKYRNVKCKALVKGVESYIDVNQAVATARMAVKNKRNLAASSARVTPAAPVVVTPAPVNIIDHTPSVSSGISVTVVNEDVVNRVVLRSDLRPADSIIQNGKPVVLEQITDRKSNVCFIFQASGSTYKNNQVIQYDSMLVKTNNKNLFLVSTDLSIECVRFDGKSGWTVMDLQNVLKGVFTVNAL